MEIDLNLGFTKKNTRYLETSKHIRSDTTRPDGVRGELDSRARCTLPGSQACGRKAVPMCEVKLPPSDMATAPSAAAADDVRGLARGEDGGINIKICWIWTEVGRDRAMEEERAHLVDLLVPHPARSSQGGVVARPPACCRQDVRGLGLLPAAGPATLPAVDRISAAYSDRLSRPQQRVVDEVPPALVNVESKVAFPISDDGRTSLTPRAHRRCNSLDHLGACSAATIGARSRRHRRSLTVAILRGDGSAEGGLVAEGAVS
ncbi:unnamed protein product [Miscanthus lutarioriparius]|uniref:Uncharacterized protein n=1 Tax=Miscanthus lutarioriparius TaxID=422564 RepID=A0A811NHI4_9POAL|nr:unnamed protein product [Miscanthus lutarioriparius]